MEIKREDRNVLSKRLDGQIEVAEIKIDFPEIPLGTHLIIPYSSNPTAICDKTGAYYSLKGDKWILND
jgi:hypothetical protein